MTFTCPLHCDTGYSPAFLLHGCVSLRGSPQGKTGREINACQISSLRGPPRPAAAVRAAGIAGAATRAAAVPAAWKGAVRAAGLPAGTAAAARPAAASTAPVVPAPQDTHGCRLRRRPGHHRQRAERRSQPAASGGAGRRRVIGARGIRGDIRCRSGAIAPRGAASESAHGCDLHRVRHPEHAAVHRHRHVEAHLQIQLAALRSGSPATSRSSRTAAPTSTASPSTSWP